MRGVYIFTLSIFILPTTAGFVRAQNCFDVGYVAGCDASGDFNGDGIVDISDPVAALTYLFSGGPKPHSSVRFEVYAAMWEELNQSEFNLMAKWAELDSCNSLLVESQQLLFECSERVRPGVPPTGQTECYDESGAVIDCNSWEYAYEDADSAQPIDPTRFYVSGPGGQISDKATGLTWAAATLGPMTWAEALRACRDLTTGNQGWRLPNVRELQTIVDFGREGPSCDPLFNAQWGQYWTSTSMNRQNSGWAWTVNFTFGDVVASFKPNGLYVRAVRGGR